MTKETESATSCHLWMRAWVSKLESIPEVDCREEFTVERVFEVREETIRKVGHSDVEKKTTSSKYTEILYLCTSPSLGCVLLACETTPKLLDRIRLIHEADDQLLLIFPMALLQEAFKRLKGIPVTGHCMKDNNFNRLGKSQSTAHEDEVLLELEQLWRTIEADPEHPYMLE